MRYDDLIGAPYKAHGRGESGLDCFGLILAVAKQLGKNMPDVWYERSDPALMTLAGRMGVHKIETLAPSRVIEVECFRRLHLGCVIDGGRMLHAAFEGAHIDAKGIYTIRGYYAFD
jgi:cell wall-associated NlpC family hydrolase